MQLISRKQLFELAGTSKLGESESSPDFDYQEFKSVWEKINTDIKNASTDSKEDIINTTYMYVRKWLKNNKEFIKFAGEGSSRDAFVLNDLTCLKIAKYKKGLAQNKQEIKNYSRNTDLKCFTQIYDFDKPIYSSILVECCSEATHDDFEKLYGLSVIDIVNQLLILKHSFENFTNKSLHILIKSMIKYTDTNIRLGKYDKIKFWENCLSDKAPQWNVMRDILNFYKNDPNNIAELLIEDLELLKNWGLAYREGKLVLVILDYGFSKTVYDEFY